VVASSCHQLEDNDTVRASPFIKPSTITLPKLGTKVRIKQGSASYPVPFGAASGTIVKLEPCSKRTGTTTISVQLPTGVIVKNLSFADVVELETRSYVVRTHAYDQATHMSAPHDIGETKALNPTANILATRPMLAPLPIERSRLERKAAAYQRLAADVHREIQCQSSPVIQRAMFAKREAYARMARATLFTLLAR